MSPGHRGVRRLGRGKAGSGLGKAKVVQVKQQGRGDGAEKADEITRARGGGVGTRIPLSHPPAASERRCNGEKE